jgi:hypothetical protein
MGNRIPRAVLWAASATVLGLYLFIAIRRMLAPVPLDPAESAVLEHAVRLASLKPLYTEPGPQPLSILPGFPFTIAVLVQALGPHLWEPRLVALLATLGLAAIVLLAVRSETESWTMGVVSVALTLAGLAILTGMPATGRPEPLMLLLSFAAFIALRDVDGSPGAVIAALLLGVACFTHQAGLWFAAGAVVHLAMEERRRLMPFLLGFAAFAGGGYVGLSQVFGSWFNFYAADVPLQAMRFDAPVLARVAGEQILGRMGVLIVVAVLSFALPNPLWRGGSGLWFWLGAGSLGASLLGSQSVHAGAEALMPCVAAFALIGPVAASRVAEHLSAWPGSTRLGGERIVFAVMLLQLALYLSAASPSLL